MRCGLVSFGKFEVLRYARRVDTVSEVVIVAAQGEFVVESPSSNQPRCERNQRSRVTPCSLILYSSVPLPVERLSSKPNLHNLLK